MMIDHYGAIFQSDIEIFRIIGRIAFPIYCFQLVEGYRHTRNAKKYATRLLIFAFISEIPFDLAFYGQLSFYHQNIFFTLFIGLVTIYLIDNHEKYNLSKWLIYLVAGFLSILLAVDYNVLGLIYILIFFHTKDYPKDERFLRIGLIMAIASFVFSHTIQLFALLALPILYFYNGQLGPRSKALQFLFYAAYPMHLFIFYLMQVLG